VAPITPIGEPTSARAGDTWTWTKTFSQFAPSEAGGTWTLSYLIAGVARLTWSGSWVSTSGSTWTILIPAASTAVLPEGRYEWQAILTGGAGYANQRYVAETGIIAVSVNPDAVVTRRAFAEEQLAAVETVLGLRLGSDVESYSIGGRSVSAIPVAQLWQMRRNLRTELWRLNNPGQSLPGRAVRFGQVGDPA
jgi:hypothetical protein